MFPVPGEGDPLPENSRFSVYIPRATPGKTKSDCGFRPDPRSRKYIDKGDIIAWLRVLSDDYVAEEHITHIHGFDYFMYIRKGNNPLFLLHYTRDLPSFRLQRDSHADLFNLMDDDERYESLFDEHDAEASDAQHDFGTQTQSKPPQQAFPKIKWSHLGTHDWALSIETPFFTIVCATLTQPEIAEREVGDLLAALIRRNCNPLSIAGPDETSAIG
jgi:hypothetical protein